MKLKVEFSSKTCDICDCEAFTPGKHKCGNCGTYHINAAVVDYTEYFEDTEGKCRECGCTDVNACQGGCYWVAENLCSKCGVVVTRTYIQEVITTLKTPGINSKQLIVNELTKVLENIQE